MYLFLSEPKIKLENQIINLEDEFRRIVATYKIWLTFLQLKIVKLKLNFKLKVIERKLVAINRMKNNYIFVLKLIIKIIFE